MVIIWNSNNSKNISTSWDLSLAQNFFPETKNMSVKHNLVDEMKKLLFFKTEMLSLAVWLFIKKFGSFCVLWLEWFIASFWTPSWPERFEFWTLTILCVHPGIFFKLLTLFLGFRKLDMPLKTSLQLCIGTLLLRQLSCLPTVGSGIQVPDPWRALLEVLLFSQGCIPKASSRALQVLHLPFLFTTFPLVLIVLNINNLQSTYMWPTILGF